MHYMQSVYELSENEIEFSNEAVCTFLCSWSTSLWHIKLKNFVICMVLVGKPDGRRPLGRTRRRWEDNIKMGLKTVKWEGTYWINLAQDRNT